MTGDPYPGRCPQWFHSDPAGGGARCELTAPHPGRLCTVQGFDGPIVWGGVSRSTAPLVVDLVAGGEAIGEAVLNRTVTAEVVVAAGVFAETPPSAETVAELDGFTGERVLRFAASLLRTDLAGLLSGTVVRDDDERDNADSADMARAVAARIDAMLDDPGAVHGPPPSSWARYPERMAQVAAVDDLSRRARAARDLKALAHAIADPAVGTPTLPTILGTIRRAVTTLEETPRA